MQQKEQPTPTTEKRKDGSHNTPGKDKWGNIMEDRHLIQPSIMQQNYDTDYNYDYDDQDDEDELKDNGLNFKNRRMSKNDLALVSFFHNEEIKLREWLNHTIKEPGGAFRIVEYLCGLDMAGLRLAEEMIDNSLKHHFARAYKVDGDNHGLFEAARNGSLPWMKMLVKQGSPIDWRDHRGKNVVSVLYQHRALLNKMDEAPIGKRSEKRMNSLAIRWIKHQEAIARWLEGRPRAKVFSEKDWSTVGLTMKDVCMNNRELALQSIARRSAKLNHFVIGCYAEKKTKSVKHKKIEKPRF